MYYKVSRDKFLKQIFLFVFFITLVFSLFLTVEGNLENRFSIQLTYMLIGVYALLQIVVESKKHTFSCNMFHWIYIWFFMFCSPYLQYITGSFSLNYVPTDNEILRTNYLIIIWEIVYSIFFYFKRLRTPPRRKETRVFDYNNINTYKLNSVLSYCLVVSLCLAVFMFMKGGIDILFSRSSGEGVFIKESSALTSLFTYVARNFVTFSAALAVINYKKNKKAFLLIVMLVLLLITCSPIGMPRFQTATVYCGILIIAFPKLSKNYLFIVGFTFAFIIIFPFINSFRYGSLLDVDIFSLLKETFDNIIKNFTDANFDSYVMFMKAQKFVTLNGKSYGVQLLGAILFFLPRSLWPNKPYGTGYTIHIAEGKLGAAANVSCPLMAEGYINFGVLGLILFAAILGYVVCKFDYMYFNSKNTKKNLANNVVYSFIPTILFFMMRGDLMSTSSFLFSYIVVGNAIVI